jgi:hypothetical protein
MVEQDGPDPGSKAGSPGRGRLETAGRGEEEGGGVGGGEAADGVGDYFWVVDCGGRGMYKHTRLVESVEGSPL